MYLDTSYNMEQRQAKPKNSHSPFNVQGKQHNTQHIWIFDTISHTWTQHNTTGEIPKHTVSSTKISKIPKESETIIA